MYIKIRNILIIIRSNHFHNTNHLLYITHTTIHYPTKAININSKQQSKTHHLTIPHNYQWGHEQHVYFISIIIALIGIFLALDNQNGVRSVVIISSDQPISTPRMNIKRQTETHGKREITSPIVKRLITHDTDIITDAVIVHARYGSHEDDDHIYIGSRLYSTKQSTYIPYYNEINN